MITGVPAFSLGAIAVGLLVLPLAGIFKCKAGWPRGLMIGYTILTMLLGVGSMVGMLFAGPEVAGQTGGLHKTLDNTLFAAMIMSACSSFLINVLAGIQPRR